MQLVTNCISLVQVKLLVVVFLVYFRTAGVIGFLHCVVQFRDKYCLKGRCWLVGLFDQSLDYLGCGQMLIGQLGQY